MSKSYVINTDHISAIDTNMVYLKDEEIPIGNNFKEIFFSNYVDGKIIKK